MIKMQHCHCTYSSTLRVYVRRKTGRCLHSLHISFNFCPFPPSSLTLSLTHINTEHLWNHSYNNYLQLCNSQCIMLSIIFTSTLMIHNGWLYMCNNIILQLHALFQKTNVWLSYFNLTLWILYTHTRKNTHTRTRTHTHTHVQTHTHAHAHTCTHTHTHAHTHTHTCTNTCTHTRTRTHTHTHVLLYYVLY